MSRPRRAQEGGAREQAEALKKFILETPPDPEETRTAQPRASLLTRRETGQRVRSNRRYDRAALSFEMCESLWERVHEGRSGVLLRVVWGVLCVGVRGVACVRK